MPLNLLQDIYPLKEKLKHETDGSILTRGWLGPKTQLRPVQEKQNKATEDLIPNQLLCKGIQTTSTC